MAATAIPYVTKTWHPTTGCTPPILADGTVSPGCAKCWARALANGRLQRFFPRGFANVTCHPDRLDEPLKWRKPQVVAVSFMSDLFHNGVPDEFIARVLDKTYQTPQHTYLILTKRPARIREFMLDNERYMPLENALAGRETAWPQGNLFLGVSVEDQASADERIPLLLETPAAHRWISAEPLLEPISLGQFLLKKFDPVAAPDYEVALDIVRNSGLSLFDGVVVGGESGPRHRPCDPAWIADILQQCDAARVPVWVKQASHRYPGRQGDIPDALWARKEVPW